MTPLQYEILQFLAACKEPQTAAWIVDRTSLDGRRHSGPNGNDGGGDWRNRSVGSVLSRMAEYGWVSPADDWPKTWVITGKGRLAMRHMKPRTT